MTNNFVSHNPIQTHDFKISSCQKAVGENGSKTSVSLQDTKTGGACLLVHVNDVFMYAKDKLEDIL